MIERTDIGRIERIIDNGHHATIRARIGGEEAVELLKRNTHNRPPKTLAIETFRNEMASGRWIFNGQPISFDSNGVMSDGQNRMLALAGLAGTPVTIELLIVAGLEPHAQLTMDQGTRRSPSDQMNLADIRVDKTAAASVRIIMTWRRKLLFVEKTKATASAAEMIAWANEHPEMIARIHEASEHGWRGIKMRASLSLAIGSVLMSVDHDAAVEFMNTVKSGWNIGPTSPIAALRARLDYMYDRSNNVKSATDRELIALCVYAWNAWRDGRELTKLQAPKGGWTEANFPEPK